MEAPGRYAKVVGIELVKEGEMIEGDPGEGVEIHGSNPLDSIKYPGIEDSFRLQVFEQVVNIINKHKIEIIRIGYNNAKEIAKFNKTQNRKLYGLHMLNFSHVLDLLTRTHRILVAMDSVNQDVVSELSRMIYVQTSDTLMFQEMDLSYVIKKPFNILESVVYVDSRFSELMQLSDVAGYLFNKMDYRVQGRPLSKFGEQLVAIGNKINPKLVHNRITTMGLNRKP